MITPAQDLVTHHWNQRARSYQFNISKDFFTDRVSGRWRGLLEETLGPGRPREVLDAGCGPAVLTRLLLDLGHRVTAVDVSEEMLEIARQKVSQSESYRQATFQRASVSELPFENDSFDAVLSRYVIWTLPDPIGALREWYRIVKPGGLVGIIDGNWYYDYYHNRFKRLWSQLATLHYKIRSGFDPGQKLATGYARGLPCSHVRRPDWDVGVLGALGYLDVTVRQGLEQQIWGRVSLHWLKSPWSHQFLITGRKAPVSAAG